MTVSCMVQDEDVEYVKLTEFSRSALKLFCTGVSYSQETPAN